MKTKYFIVAALTVCLLAAMVAVWPRPKGDVVVVGDSVIFMSGGSIDSALDATRRTEILAIPYYRSIDLVPSIKQRTGARDEIITLIGYNDIRRDTDTGSGINTLMEETSKYGCSVFLTLPIGSLDLYKTVRWNARIVQLAERYGIHVSNEWKDVANGNPKVFLEDGVHPTEEGKRALARSITNALNQFCL